MRKSSQLAMIGFIIFSSVCWAKELVVPLSLPQVPDSGASEPQMIKVSSSEELQCTKVGGHWIKEDFYCETAELKEKKTQCIAKGGKWVRGYGPAGTPKFCQLPVSDGGKPCQDGSECESNQCLAQFKPGENHYDPINKKMNVPIGGKCHTEDSVLGAPVLVKGKLTFNPVR